MKIDKIYIKVRDYGTKYLLRADDTMMMLMSPNSYSNKYSSYGMFQQGKYITLMLSCRNLTVLYPVLEKNTLLAGLKFFSEKIGSGSISVERFADSEYVRYNIVGEEITILKDIDNDDEAILMMECED